MGVFSRNNTIEFTSESSADALANYHKPKPTALRLFTSTCYLFSLVFLTLVCIGSISNKPVVRDTYFLTINLANVIPASVPNANFINSIARTIGLHDFYQVGLWNFCEGYNGEGITYCSAATSLYWFDPVSIILNELLAGATVELPTEVISALKIVRIASHWIFASFLVGASLTFVCIFLGPMAFSQKPRWEHRAKRIFLRSLPITVVTFLALLFTAGASVIATVMFVIFRNTFSGAADLNITASLGTSMLAFMWTASAFNLLGFLVQMGTCCGICCCTGRRKAVRKSQESGSELEEKHFGRKLGTQGRFGQRSRKTAA